MTRHVVIAAALAALVLPTAAFAGDTFAVVSDTAAPAAPALPSALAENSPGAIAVDESFTARPVWIEQLPVDQLQQIWERAGSAYGVPWQVLAAINKIESDFGANMGPSSAGAVGWMQFMPDTWLRWGVDANGDGVADPWNAEDAIYSAARYLAASGGGSDIQRAVFSYNHADWYVNEVLTLANAYAGGTVPSASFGLAPAPVDLTPLIDRVNAARDALASARSAEQQLAPAFDSARAAFRRTSLLSDRLDAQKRLTIVGVRYDRAGALTRSLERELAAAQRELAQARTAAEAVPSPIFGGLPSLVAADTFGAFPSAFAGTSAVGPAGGALQFALAQLGIPYQWGAEGPYTFDCSGLVQAAYASAGVALPRVAQQQYDAGPLVPAGEPLQAGDLVFFGSDAAHVEHVGLVTGPGLMVDAPYTGTVVRFDSYQRASYVGATRPAAGVAVPLSASTDGPVVDFSTVQAVSPATGDLLFTKNP